MKREDFSLEENSINKALSKFDVLFSKEKIILSIQRRPYFNDEPKLYDFSTSFYYQDKNLKKVADYGGGIDQSRKKALVKSLGEALERYCISKQRKKVFATYKEIKGKAINIFEFNDFSNKQQVDPNFKKFTYNENTKFYWRWGFDLFNLKKTLIPSQLISVPYKYENEQIIRYPITTGAACSTSLSGAIYRGICEIIERDAFMITYLNKLERNHVDLEKSGRTLKELKETYSRYNLELHIVEITTDLQIPAMLGLILDRTGIGPAVSVGLSADLDPLNAAIKAAQEALHSRPWIRKLMILGDKTQNINTFKGRALYWSDPKMISKLDFLINKNKKNTLKHKSKEISTSEKMKLIAKKLQQKKLSTCFVDVTTKKIKAGGFWVIKVLIPKLQALSLDENVPYLGNERLNKVPVKLGYTKRHSFNKIPHPFL